MKDPGDDRKRVHQRGTHQAALRDSYWLFGGSYVASLKRRRYTTGMEIDIPLLRPDDSLHVVELKRAKVSLIKRHRTGLIIHSAVHEGVSQAMNYPRTLDLSTPGDQPDSN